MNILVVGGYSFIGTHIVNYFIEKNHSVSVIDNLNRRNKRYIVGKHTSFNYSVNSHKCEKPFKNNKFDAVIHLTNMKGFANISGLCEKYCIDKMIVANDTDERFTIKNESIFSITYDNIFGPRQNKQNLVSDLINQVLNFENIKMPGNGDEIIKLLYVKDVATMIYNICIGEISENKLNLLIGQSCTVNEIIEILRTEHTIPIVISSRLNDEKNIAIDEKNESSKFNYYPLAQGIKETYEWYKNIYIKKFNNWINKNQDYTA